MDRMELYPVLIVVLVLAWAATLYAGFPTHPNQVGLAGVGMDRNNLPASSTTKFTSADNGKVITNQKFGGTVTLDGTKNITFRRCWFTGGGVYSVRHGNNGAPVNTTFEDCDFGSHGEGKWVSASHLISLNGTNHIRRCFFYNSADGIKWSNGSVNYIENSWVQPIYVPDKHTDCMQLNDNIRAKVYAKECTFDHRTWTFNGMVSHTQEELKGGNVSVTNIAHWGNSILQTKVTSISSQCYFSFVGCLMTGGNYIITASGQAGEFKNNMVVRGSANPRTDIGLRNVENFSAVSGNVFHDNGMTYFGGKVIGGYTATPIPKLNLYGVTGISLQPITNDTKTARLPNPLKAADLKSLAAVYNWQVFNCTGQQVPDQGTGIYFVVTGNGQQPVKVQLAE